MGEECRLAGFELEAMLRNRLISSPMIAPFGETKLARLAINRDQSTA
jgi:hypothetical protein